MKVSILGTCQECLHYADGMCDLRPRICVNYDHFVWDEMIVISKNDLEQKYVSRFALDAALKRAEAAEARLAERDAEVARLTAALAAANEDAERLADKLSEVVAYGGYYADIENRMPPDGQTFKVIAVSLGGVDDFTVLRMDGKLYFASDPPREVPRGFEIIRIKPWDVKTFGKTEEEDF